MYKRTLPRILIAAASSGSGKTVITCGLLAYLKKNVKSICSFKCGPDYIDPMFHRNVLGITGGNLDSFFSTKEEMLRILGTKDCEYALIEGVMGIYDGLGGTHLSGSSYDIAIKTSTPIVLVINGHGCGRTIVSLIRGIVEDDSENLIKGIILNNTSEYIYGELSEPISKMLSDIGSEAKLLGYVPKIKDINIESRYLGLKMPDEISDIKRQTDLISETIAKTVDMDAFLNIMNCAPSFAVENIEENLAKTGLTLAVAKDEAFCFYYEENLNVFRQKGVNIKFFSPLEDDAVPDDADGIYFGGGYPELYLSKLSANKSMLESVKTVLNKGMPSLAECGGFMYLHTKIYDDTDTAYDMVGAIDAECRKTDRLVRFGYICLESKSDELSFPEISEIKGHEFHYYDSTNNGSSMYAVKPVSERRWECMHILDNHVWGFPHLYYASKPGFVDNFIAKMKEYNNLGRKHKID